MRKSIFKTLSFFAAIFVVTTANAQIEFVQNKGQWDTRADYMGNFTTGSFYLENKGFTVDLHNPADMSAITEFQHGTSKSEAGKPGPGNSGNIILHSHVYKVNFLGAGNAVQAVPDKAMEGYNNYFIGDDRSKWTSNCKIYQALTYKNVYPNIDVRYYSDAVNHLKYDIIIHPGGNPDAIAMRYDGVTKLEVKNKELIIGTSVGDVKELYPYTYQSTDKSKAEIDCKYSVRDNVVTFKVGNYDRSQTLVIDPSLIFSTFTGSTQDNWGYTATPGPGGSLYAAGIVFGNGFPTSAGTYQTVFGGGITEDNFSGYDIGIMKFSANGTSRLFATYLGGNGNEQPHSMICDAQGDLIIAGRTSSGNFPGTPTRTTHDFDIFVTKLSPNGNLLLGSVRVGGVGQDGVNIRGKYASPDGVDATRRNYGDDARSEVLVDGGGNIYLASCTQSPDFPVTANAVQKTFNQGSNGTRVDGLKQDGVIMKFNPALTTTLFSTFFGGSEIDACFVLSINPITGHLYVAGGTNSKDIPGSTTGVIQPANKGGVDGFITELLPDGSAIVRTTYQGTDQDDLIYGIQFDKFGFPYIMGTTLGSWTVTSNVIFHNDGAKQFISKLQPDLSAYVYSTVFGTSAGAPNLSPVAFLVDRCQNVYVSGWGGGVNQLKGYPTAGTLGLPEVNPLSGIPAADGADFYFFVMEKNANSQLFGSHFGQRGGFGDHVDGGTSRFDVNGIIYQALCANCGGRTSATFPTTAGAWAPFNGTVDNCNEAAVKIEMNFTGVGASVKATIDGIIDTIGCVPLTVKFTDTLAKGKMYVWVYNDPYDTKIDTSYAPNNSVSHTYSHVGSYKLMLTSIDSSTCNIADTVYATIRVGSNEVVPNFAFSKLDSCSSLRYLFTNLTTATVPTYNAQSFLWDFGDGSTKVRADHGPVIHTFPSVGSYKIRLLVDDTTFCNAPQFKDSTLRISPNVKAQFKTDPRGCAPYTAKFQNTSLGGTDFIWEFGDTKTSTDASPIVLHDYLTTGTYKVRLIAIDTSTCNKRDTSAYFTITVYPLPTAAFTWSPDPPKVNTPTNFINQSSTDATKFLWDFGDGETSVVRDPIHQFNATGTFTVTLVAYNPAGCTDTAVKLVPAVIVPLLDVPNAFTPGRFGTNAVVKVVGFGISKLSWKIYNRWGQLVFQTTDRKQGWDGTFKGQLQPMDVYTYTLDVEFSDNQKLRKTGDINLLR